MGGVCKGGRAAVVHFVGYTIPQAQNAEGRKKTIAQRCGGREEEREEERKAGRESRNVPWGRSDVSLLPIVIETRDILHN